jgi:Tol biopolymer transport system component
MTAGLAVAQLHPPVIVLVSQTARGMSAEGRSEIPAVNLNGLIAAYSSDAVDLVSPPAPNPLNQTYARDLTLVTSALVSKAPDGTAGNRPSQNSGFPPGISDDGRFIAFSSGATNLVPDDTNGLEDVFVYDRQQGTTQLISQGIDGPSNGVSSLPKISGDGRYVVFQSNATNLVADPGNAVSDIYLFDRTTGATVRLSVAADGSPANGQSITPNISADGRVVAFASRATNLVDQPTTGTFEQVFAREWQTGHTELVSLSSGGAPGNATSFLPALSGDGSQVAFKSEAFNLVPNDTNGVPDVFVRDRTNGTTQRVSVDSFGNQSNGLSGGPGISSDGRFVAFPSFASNLVPEDSSGQGNVYVYDRSPSGRSQGLIARVTVGLDGAQPNDGVSDFPVTISGDGRWIGFASAASNLVPNDFNNELDAFLGCNPFDEFACAAPTPTPAPHACVGDCNGDGEVTIDDLIRMVNIALDLQPLCPSDASAGCLAGDADCDCAITVDEIIRGVQNSLQTVCHDFGDCTMADHEQMCCAAPPATSTPTPTAPATPAATTPG